MRGAWVGILIAAAASLGPVPARGQEVDTAEPVIPANIERRDIRIPRIKASDLELGAYAGVLSVQDFGTRPSYGLRLGYHVTEDYFIEGVYGRSTVSDESFRRLGIAIFNEDKVDLSYYSLSIGANLFPGEIFIGNGRAMTSVVYLAGGVGRVSFGNEDHTTYSLGIGIRVLPVDWFSMRFEMNDHMFTSDLLGKNELKHNFEMTLGAGFFF